MPVLNLHLGSSDNGELPKSTTARQAYDLITEGFGAGTNGPLLVSVKLGTPAKPDQKQLDQLNDKQKQQQQKEQQQEQQTAEQLEAQGVPPDQAESQAKQQVQKQSEPGRRSSRTRRSRPSHLRPTRA